VSEFNVLLFGSNGLVGSSLKKNLSKSSKVSKVYASTREDADLFNLKETSKLIQKINPDIIINAAAKVGGIVANNTQRSEFILENLKINMNILESVVPYPKIKVINLGSSCIYPLNAETPINEKSIMTGVLEPTNSPYSMAKLSAIELGRALNIQFGHKIINLMPTNLYGPNDFFSEENSHVIPGLFFRMHSSKLRNDKEFKIWGTGKPLREFMHVNDLSDAVEFLLDKEIDNDLLNVGTGEEISIYELAEKIKNVVGFEGSINFDTSKPDGNPRKLLDSKLINEMGWKSKINLDNGLKNTYEWFVENIDKIRK